MPDRHKVWSAVVGQIGRCSSARPTPIVQLALVHRNAAQLLKVPMQDVQHSPGSVRRRQKVDVVKVSKHSLPFPELALSNVPGWLDGERKSPGIKGSPCSPRSPCSTK